MNINFVEIYLLEMDVTLANNTFTQTLNISHSPIKDTDVSVTKTSQECQNYAVHRLENYSRAVASLKEPIATFPDNRAPKRAIFYKPTNHLKCPFGFVIN
jgi:hypothetical protein